jgi:hypothetical protein
VLNISPAPAVQQTDPTVLDGTPTQSSILHHSLNNSKDTGKSTFRSKASSKNKGFEHKQVYIDPSSKINYETFKVKHIGQSMGGSNYKMKRGAPQTS